MTIILSDDENMEEIPKLCDRYWFFLSYIFHIRFELFGHLNLEEWMFISQHL